MTGPIDYNAVLADLLAKRGQIDAAIEVIRALVGATAATDSDGNGVAAEATLPLPQLPISPPKGAAPRQPIAIENDTFFGLNIAGAVRKYLGMMKRPQTAQTITEALHAGGQINSSDVEAAYGSVYSALTRNKDFVKTRNKEWGLAEWYGNNKVKSEGE